MTTGAKTAKGIDTFADVDSPDLGPLGLGVILNEIDALAIKKFPLNGTVDVASNAGEVSLLGGGIAIPAGMMGANGSILFALIGDYLNNTGAGQTLTHRIKFGGTTFWGHAIAPPTGAIRYPWAITFWLPNLGAANSNYMNGGWWIGNTAAGAAGSIAGLLGLSTPIGIGSNGVQAIDTTLAQTLDVTTQHGVSSASLSCRRHFAIAGLL